MKLFLHYFIIICLGVINAFISLINFFLENVKEFREYNLQNEIRFVGIIYVCFLCYRVLKIEMKKHHIFSIIIIILVSIILAIVNVCSITFQKEQITLYIVKLILLIICDIFYSSKHVTEKWLMDSKFFSPYKILFIEGLSSFCFCIVSFLILSFINCPFDEFCRSGHKFFEIGLMLNECRDNYGYYIAFFISGFGVDLFIILTVKIFNPAFRPIFDTLLSIGMAYNLFKMNNEGIIWKVVKIISYIFIIFADLIFNEIILINCFNISKDTRNNISIRGENEYEDCIKKLDIFVGLNDERKEEELNGKINLYE